MEPNSNLHTMNINVGQKSERDTKGADVPGIYSKPPSTSAVFQGDYNTAPVQNTVGDRAK